MDLTPATVFAIVLVALFATAAVPTAIDAVHDTNTTGWTAGEVALWSFIGLAIIGVVVLAFIPGGAKGGT